MTHQQRTPVVMGNLTRANELISTGMENASFFKPPMGSRPLMGHDPKIGYYPYGSRPQDGSRPPMGHDPKISYYPLWVTTHQLRTLILEQENEET